MRHVLCVFWAALAASALATAAPSVRAATAAAPGVRAIPVLPIRFEPAPDRAGHFLAKGRDYEFDIQSCENTLIWHGKHAAVSLRTRFLKARDGAEIEGLGLLASRTNYFFGASPKAWRTDVANFEKIRVSELYPGIDLLFHGSEGSLEYDFIARPGADPAAIQFQILGASRVRLDGYGDLLVSHGKDTVRWKAPLMYQSPAGAGLRVDGRYELGPRHTVRFRIGEYDHSRELIIDPVLSHASYLGGSGKELARGVATDGAGNVYVAGGTTSRDLQVTPGTVQPVFKGPSEVFVAKFSAAGALLYTTFLGGSLIDYATALAVDDAGNAYVTGVTESTDFPVTDSAFQRRYGGGGGGTCQRAGDAFVFKLNPTGSQLLYSTYLGGQRDDIATAIAIDPEGNAYIAGSTLSTNFPTTQGALQTTFLGLGGQVGKPICNGLPWFNSGDGFVSKLNPAGSQLVFSTYVGGRLDDSVLALAVDPAHNVYVGGFTLSPDLPVTASAYQRAYRGVESQNEFFHVGDGFIAKLASTGASLIYMTYLGGSGDDGISSLVALADGSVWAAGWSTSLDYPVTATAVQKTFSGYRVLPFEVEQSTGDAIVAHLDATGSRLLYSTFFGGSRNDVGTALAVDKAGLVYLAGFSDSPDLPATRDAAQPRLAGSGGSNLYFQFGDGFLAVIDPNASAPVYSSYFGGGLDDEFFGIALDRSGGVWTTGNTISTNLPVTGNATQRAYGGQRDPTVGTYGDAFLVHVTGLGGPAGPVIGALQNAASTAPGMVSPGMIFVLYGTGLGPATLAGAALDSAGKLATTIAGVTITFDGVLAPLVYVSSGQVAGVAPYSIANRSSTQIAVQYNGQSAAPLVIPVAPAAPGLFSANFTGSGPAVAFNQDGSLNTAANPAAKGSVMVFFGTGEGQTNPAGVDGRIVLPDALATPVGGCSASVGRQTATVLYCGSVPFVVAGELQVNLQLSSLVDSGSQPVIVRVGSLQSQPNLTVFIQ